MPKAPNDYRGLIRANRVQVETLEAIASTIDWASMYRSDKNLPTRFYTARSSCKIFHDGILLVRETLETPKVLQDRLPSALLRPYGKKMWQRNFVQCVLRVLCRLAKGYGMAPNCKGEDMATHVLISWAKDHGRNRIREFLAPLPTHQYDDDFERLRNSAADSEVLGLYSDDAPPTNAKDFFMAREMDRMMDYVIELPAPEEEAPADDAAAPAAVPAGGESKGEAPSAVQASA